MGDEGSDAAFAGVYSGVVAGAAATLTLQRAGDRAEGALDVAGYGYEVNGVVAGDRFTGELADPALGRRVPLLGAAIDGGVALDAGGGPMAFHRSDSGTPEVHPAATGEPPTGRVPMQPPGEGDEGLDPALVGQWRRTETMASGEFTMASDYFLAVAADGTFESASGGSAGSMGTVSQGVQVTGRGRWRVQGDLVLLDEGWGYQPFARYQAAGVRLMFVFGDGSTQVWERIG